MSNSSVWLSEMIVTYLSQYPTDEWNEYIDQTKKAWLDTAKKWSDNELIDAYQYFTVRRIKIRVEILGSGYDPNLIHDLLVAREIGTVFNSEIRRRKI